MIDKNSIYILKGNEIKSLFASKEKEILNIIKAAYLSHTKGESSLPHSSFLTLPKNQKDRIIALPAYLGGEFEIAGIKWIASFPDNIEHGLDRASAVIVLNSIKTGRPEAILEGSIISATRTAASAALAAKNIYEGEDLTHVGIIGCGPINYHILKFLSVVWPNIKTIYLCDVDEKRANYFKNKCLNELNIDKANVFHCSKDVIAHASLISIATTAGKPHIFDISSCISGTVILHISLRDLSTEVILECDNVVDDVDHICHAQTSVHLTERLTGNHNFIRCTLGEILLGQAPSKKDNKCITVFSPFGLGILDIALGKYAYEIGVKSNKGTWIDSFLSSTWS